MDSFTHSLRYLYFTSAACLACLLMAVFFWPIPTLQIHTMQGDMILNRHFLAGDSFTTRIIHSVERTPVEDEYRIVHQKIWSWQERVRSHNAGLPFDKQENGSFLIEPPWFIIQGGQLSFDEINYRVGLEDLGNNHIRFGNGEWTALYELYPMQRLVFSVGSGFVTQGFLPDFQHPYHPKMLQ